MEIPEPKAKEPEAEAEAIEEAAPEDEEKK
jgi:hypothetical protein